METLRVFSYLTAEKAALYRSLMASFVEAKGRFVLNLRASDLAQNLSLAVPEVEVALKQLVDWGNLKSHLDTSDVVTIKDFYSARFLYQISKEGEAADFAVRTYFIQLEQSGELQSAALTDIQNLLKDLLNLWSSSSVDETKVFLTLSALKDRFESLTQRAQDFMRGLQESIEIPSENLLVFQAYKEMLINYLEKFMKELVLLTPSITQQIAELEKYPVREWMSKVAKRELIDALNPSQEDYDRVTHRWLGRWSGLRSWFVGSSEAPSQSEILRARVRRAIPALLMAIQRINDRRANRSDRFADYCTLAKWFAQAQSDREAHQIWAAAFNLVPTRHLRVDQQTLNERENHPISSSTSWSDASPIWVSPRLRSVGSYQRKGRASSITNKVKERELLALRMAEELSQIEKAQTRLATGERIKLTDLSGLSNLEFGLFLDLLGEALTKKKHPLEKVTALSTDGSLEIELEPIEGSVRVRLTTEKGDFSGPNHWICIRPSFSLPAYSRSPKAEENLSHGRV